MRIRETLNTVILTTLAAACGPLPADPTTTDAPPLTTSNGGGTTDGATGVVPTSTGTTSSTTSPGTTSGEVSTSVAATTTGAPDLLPEVCSPILCSECPNDSCVEAGHSLCTKPGTDEIFCREDLLFCEGLFGLCDDGTPCPAAAPLCQDGVCVSSCEADEDCGLDSVCANSNRCVNALGQTVCTVVPHDDPPQEDPLFCTGLLNPCGAAALCSAGAPDCINNVCLAACETAENCGKDRLCTNGACVDFLGNLVCKDLEEERPCVKVLCGAGPCLDARGEFVCVPEGCEPRPCDLCGPPGTCGTVEGTAQEACILLGEVACL